MNTLSRHRPHPGLRAVLTGVALLLAVVAATGPADAVDNGTVGIRPSNESDFFHLSLYPGAAINAIAVVSNHTTGPVTLLTYPVDGQSTPQGTFALAAQSDPRKGVGAWAHLDTEQITVPANTDVNVPFKLSVPAGTPPGDYAGGLIIQAPPVQGTTTTVNGDTAVRLDVVQRQGVRIYLKVAGTAIKSLDHGNLAWDRNGDNLNFTLPVKNTGNTILHPTADLALTGWPAEEHLKFDNPESLLPGGTIDLHAHLAQSPLAQIGDADATLKSEAGTDHAGAGILYVPWALLSAGLLLLAAAIYGAWRGSRFIRRAKAALAQVNNTGQASDTGTRHGGGRRGGSAPGDALSGSVTDVGLTEER